ncbi:hypothetical protein TRFO_32804 [Tritrichomonas foetus]|uniref:BAR domain-containing protein n=1 Tax=Tritrichomonas foetus TaxID=1144522 RepID=A0A1J4JMZ3_9EUKA|nr:hypothetical protein TRFO_32804 [Tritrichomonas foetus]|eukprot:OHT00489.1 hypothetical protein TRFO_32804 [Tritrichomonas foetus]
MYIRTMTSSMLFLTDEMLPSNIISHEINSMSFNSIQNVIDDKLSFFENFKGLKFSSFMKFVGRFLNKLQSFPEYKNVISDVEEMQTQDGNILNGIQQAFGPSLNEFARLQDLTFRESLISLSEVSRLEVEAMRNLLASTSSFPNDIRQLNNFHEDIQKKRKDLSELQATFDKYEKAVNSSLLELEKAQRTSMSSSFKAKAQETYDLNCKKKQEAFEALDSLKRANEQVETEYRRTFLQIIVTAFESYMHAYARSMQELVGIGEKIVEKASQLDDAGVDPSITELEARLHLLETEPMDD